MFWLFRAMVDARYEAVNAALVGGAVMLQCDSRRVPVHVIARINLLSYCSVIEGTFASIFRAPNGFLSSSWVLMCSSYQVFPDQGNAPLMPVS